MTGLPFKEDDDFRKHNQEAFDAAGPALRDFINDVESIDAQIRDIKGDRSDLFTVIKSKGYDVKVLRRLLADRRRNAAELAEEQEVLAMYKELLL